MCLTIGFPQTRSKIHLTHTAKMPLNSRVLALFHQSTALITTTSLQIAFSIFYFDCFLELLVSVKIP
jgi:hypothetical protein